MAFLRTSLGRCWPLMVAGALLAMVVGHAVELWLEDLKVVGDVRAGYMHSAQAITLELSLFGLFAVLYAILRWALGLHGAQSGQSVPVLEGAARSGRLPFVISLLATQLSALVAVELLEQVLSGLARPGLAAIFGAGHASALIVHVIVGSVIGLLFFSFAAAVSSRSRIVAQVLSTFLRRLRAANPATSAAFRRTHLHCVPRRHTLLALKLANRPPPASALA